MGGILSFIMGNIETIIAVLIIAGVPVLFCAVAVILRSTYKEDITPRLEILDAIDLPSAARRFFNDMETQLFKTGFEKNGDFLKTAHTMGDTTSFIAFRLFSKHDVGDMAMIASSYSRDGGGKVNVQDQYVEFNSDFGRRLEISTNNASTPQPYKSIEEKMVFSHTTRDIPELYRRHQQHVLDHAENMKKVYVQPGKEKAAVEKSLKNMMELLMRYGYMEKDISKGVYQLTWSGAFRTVFNMALASIKKKADDPPRRHRFPEHMKACIRSPNPKKTKRIRPAPIRKKGKKQPGINQNQLTSSGYNAKAAAISAAFRETKFRKRAPKPPVKNVRREFLCIRTQTYPTEPSDGII